MVDLLKKMKNKNGSHKIAISIVVIVLFIASVTAGILLYSNSTKKNETKETEINALEQEPNNIENKDEKDSTNDNKTEESNIDTENNTVENADNTQNTVTENVENTHTVANNTDNNNVINNAQNNNNVQTEETYFQKVIEEEVVSKEWEKVDVSWEPLAFSGAIIPADTTTRKPVIKLTKTSSTIENVTTGDKITYTIEAENIGNEVAKKLVISDKINTENVKVLSIDNNGVISEDGIVTWNIENLNVSEKFTAKITVQLNEISDEKVKELNNVEITNSAKITGENIKDVTSEEVKNDYVKPIITKEKEAYVIRDGKEVKITSLDTTSVVQGETIKYKITLKNEGTISKNVEVEDILPTELENVIITNCSNGTADNINNDKIVWNVEVQKRDEQKNPSVVTLEYTAKVKSDATGTIKNSINVDGNGSESTVTTPIVTSQKSSTVVLPTTILTGASKNVTTGTILRYDITVTNTSEDTDAQNVVIIDKIPEGTTLLVNDEYVISDDGKLSDDKTNISWNINVEKDSEKTVSFYVTVNENENNTVIENTAKVNGKDIKTSDIYVKPIITGTKEAYVTRDGKEVKITPDSSISVVRGETIKYKITLKNDGSLAKYVSVEDILPSQVENVIVTPGYNGTISNENSDMDWYVEVPAKTGNTSGTQILEYTAKVKENASGVIENSINIDNGGQESTIKTPIVVSTKTATIIDVLGNELNKDFVTTGDRIKYTITVDNTSEVEAKNVTIKDTIPEGTHIVSNTISDNGNLNTENNTITWNFDSITDTKSVTFIVEVDKNELVSTTIENTAYVNGKETDKVETTYERPNFVVEKEADRNIAKVGENITYTLTVTNTGNCAGTEVVTDTLPLDLVEIVEANGATQDGNKLSWNVTLNGNDDATTITYTVKVKDNATLIENNVATPDGSTDKEITPIVVVTKTADKTSVRPGETIKYTITVENKSTVDATGIDIKDDIRTGTTFEEFITENGGEYVSSENSNYVIWKNQVVKAGEANTYVFTVKVNSDTALGEKIENIAIVDKTSSNPVITTVEEAQITGSKLVNKQEATKGDVLTYTIILRNAGNKAGTVSMTDEIPEGTTYVPGSAKLDGNTDEKLTCVNDTKIVLDEITVEKESTRKVTFQVKVNDDVNSVIKNKASYTTEDGDFTTDEVVTAVITKTVKDENGNDINGQDVKANDILKYEITINNSENNNDKTVNILDILPSGVTLLEDESYKISDNGTNTNNTLIWRDIVVSANDTKTVSFYVRVNDTLNDKDKIRNTANVNNNNTNTVENNYIKTIIEVSKSSSVKKGTEINRGSEITYTLTAENKGGLGKGNVVITDKIPAGTTFVNADDDIVPEEVTNEDGTNSLVLTWEVDVPGYTKVEKHFTVKVDEDTVLDTINNIANINGENTNEVIDTVYYDDINVNMFEGSTTITKKNIVMVLDLSSSMAWDGKLADAKAAAVDFIKNIYKDDTIIGVNIKFITFNYKNPEYTWYGSAIKYTGTSNLTFGSGITTVTNKTEADQLIAEINKIDIPDGYKQSGLGTDIEAALNLASSNLANLATLAPNNGGVVVFLGDGKPDTYYDESAKYDRNGNITDYGYNNSVSINNKANYIKNTQKAELYTIGFHMDNEGKTIMQNIASTATEEKKYAYTADNSTELTGAFNAIGSSIGYSEFTEVATRSILTYTVTTDLVIDNTHPVIITINGVEEKFYTLTDLNNSGYANYDSTTNTITINLRNKNAETVSLHYSLS